MGSNPNPIIDREKAVYNNITQLLSNCTGSGGVLYRSVCP
eukprot:UN09856